MSKTYSINCGCKINIYLKILNRRPDGYHNLESLFYPLPWPEDYLDISVGSGRGISLRACPKSLESSRNILLRTYELFAAATDYRPGIKVYLKKNIPLGAGLGGGSSNAAAFLIFLNTLNRFTALKRDQLLELAADLGADVPFFLYNRPAWVSGKGEKVSPANIKLHGLHVLIICPGINIDTSWAYKAHALNRKESCPSHDSVLTTGPLIDKKSCFERIILSNCFEKTVFAEYPRLGSIKTQMLQAGANGCVLSGSGASLCAFFRERDHLSRACNTLDRQNVSFYYSKLN
ncbi:4-(cytidine 5'-diphospho)-2-C-methyl-D-erythritol kinase [Desulfonatronospira sp.]|uniref:4-(cytidine 5'-diphospho)-2-C-methyl-D-erythritol kinase n=1 Tax=Desulfonatronospira sp. TaxID=1962951 RepID=UPI0025C124FF|nr:4-(cytidine 5'-diphospho)-2-C-methyl-D-erythritol kinase [Desulfonatronospira sp.]